MDEPPYIRHGLAQRRAALNAKHGPRYAQIAHDICVYCGDTPSGEDHVPPLSKADWKAYAEAPFASYGACAYCNGTLSRLGEICLRDRSSYILKIIDPKDVHISRPTKTWAANVRAMRLFQSQICACPACQNRRRNALNFA